MLKFLRSFALTVALMLPFAMQAQETLTVADGTTTNEYVPVYGYYADAYLRCQIVYPADDLAEMSGATISGITFYSSDASVGWGSASFSVKIAEVESSTITDFYTGEMTTVFEGSLSISGNQMAVEFEEPFAYQGGNLLVEVNNLVTGTYVHSHWYGINSTSSSVQGYSYSSWNSISAGGMDFLPKTTFEYTPGSGDYCAKPTGVNVVFADNALTVTWNSDATSFNIDVNDEITEGVESPYVISDLELATNYVIKVQADCGSNVSNWTSPVTYTTPLCLSEDLCTITLALSDSYGDGWNGGQLSVVDVLTQTALGTYTLFDDEEEETFELSVCDGRDINFVYAPGSFQTENGWSITDVNNEVIIEHAGCDSGCDVDGGVLTTYTVSCAITDCRIPTALAFSQIASHSAQVAWTENGAAEEWVVAYKPADATEYTEIEATENSITLEDLLANTTYNVKVRPVCEDEVIKWSTVANFTTMIACPAVTNAHATVTPYTATIEWTAGSEEEAWMVYVDGDEDGVTVNEPVYVLEDLEPVSAHTVVIKADCADEGLSTAVTVNCTTLVACPAPTNLAALIDPSTPTTATINWVQPSECTTWQICLNNDMENLFDVEGEPTHTFEGLTLEMPDTVKVRAICGTGVGDTSDWSANLIFTPSVKTIIGSGTATNSYLPAYSFYNYSLTEQIYTVAEMGTPGLIESIDFYNGGSEKTRTIDIYMVNTTKSTFSGSTDWQAVTAADLVFSGEVTFTAGAWTTIVFDDPFIYDATSNVILAVDDNTGTYSSGLSCRVFDATAQAIRVYSDGTNYDPFAPSSYSGSVMNVKNQLRLLKSPLTDCERPASITVSDITAHEATVSWESEVGTYVLQYKENDSDTWTEIADITDNTYTLENLEQNTTYNVRVAAVCGDETSAWRTGANFTTPILFATPTNLTATTVQGNGTEATLSWTENGEATEWQICLDNDMENLVDADENPFTLTGLTPEHIYTAKVRSVVDGDHSSWSEPVTFQPSNKTVIGSGEAVNSYLPTYSFYNYSLTEQIYTTAELGTEPAAIMSVDFYNGGSEKTRTLDLYMVSTDKSTFANETDWVAVGTGDLFFSGTVTFTPNQWTTLTFDAPFIYDGLSNVIIAVDDNTGTYSSGLTCRVFDAAGQAIRVYSDGTNYDPAAPSAYSGTVEDVKNQVRLNMQPADGCFRPSGLNATEVGNYYAELNWNSLSEAWNLRYKVATAEEWTVVPGITEHPYSLEGLAPETSYQVQVQAVCGTEEVSDWTNAVSFTTLVACPAAYDLAVEPGPTSAIVTWEGIADGYTLQYIENTPGEGSWVNYDDGEHATSIGSSTAGTWTWGVMYPSTMLTAGYLTRVSHFETSYNTEDFTIQVYQGGETEPGTLIHTQTVTPSGNTGFEEFLLSESVAIDPTQNLWIVLTETGTYVMTACNTTEANNQWVYNNNTWQNIGDLSSSLSGYGWMIRGLIDPTDPATVAWNTVPNATSPCTITDLTPETEYIVRVKAECGADGSSAWIYNIFTTTEACPAPHSLTATDITANSATLGWTGYSNSYNVHYRPYISDGVYDFEDSDMGPWTTIDADGDGYTWMLGSEVMTTGYGHNGSEDMVLSQSYNSTDGALTPDNYLVSPLVQLGGSISFYAAAQDNLWAEEHFGVAVSTTSNTDPAAFTMIDEWDMDEDGGPGTGAKEQGVWGYYSVDLSAYAGQSGYIAIRHFDCTDMFYLNIDDITIETPGSAAENPWTEVTSTNTSVTIGGLQPNTVYEYQVQGVCDGNTTAWTGLSYFTTADGEGCDNPVITSTNADATTISMTFTGTATNYQVAIVAGNWVAPASGIATTATTYTFENLTPATAYTVGVRAICDEGLTSGWVTMVVNTIDAACEPVSGVTVSGVTMTAATVAWTVADAEQTAWDVNVTGTNFDQTFSATANPYTVTGLTPGVTYTVKVRANCGGSSVSAWSETASFTTGTCEGVTNVTVSNITANSATIAWTAAEGQTTWQIDYGAQGHPQGTGTTVMVTTNPYTLTGLTDYTPYDLYVRAVCEDGVMSDWSPKANFTTLDNGGGQGISDVNSDLVKLYPNPATTTVTIDGISGEATVSVVDMNGRTVFTAKANETLTIDLAGYVRGAYFVRISGEQTMAIRKLIVK